MGIPATRIAPVAPSGETIESDDAPRRAELRAFLMSRRARLRPSDVGLPETARRRTPGLRREEVAQLAGLSTEWYTVFEMAKDAGVSHRTIDAVAAALKLTPAEHRQLRLLATGMSQAPLPAADYADPNLRDVLNGYRTGPAMLLNTRMDVVAENALSAAIFGDLASAAGLEKNWLWYLYANHQLIHDWEAQARPLTATFRGLQCQHAGDPAYAQLVERLLATSETFRTFWSEHDVGAIEDVPPLTLTHPIYGVLHFTLRVLTQSGTAGAYYCCFLIPDEATATLPAYLGLRHAMGP